MVTKKKWLQRLTNDLFSMDWNSMTKVDKKKNTKRGSFDMRELFIPPRNVSSAIPEAIMRRNTQDDVYAAWQLRCRVCPMYQHAVA